MKANTKYFQANSTFSSGNTWISTSYCKLVSQVKNQVELEFYDMRRTIKIDKEIFEKIFKEVIPSEEIVKDFDVKFFSKRKIVDLIKTEIKNGQENLVNLINKCYQDAYYSSGSTKSATIKTDFNKTSKNEKFSPIFNRRARNSPVVPDDFCYEIGHKYPVPFGIRSLDFALKTEQNEVFKTLVIQIFGCKNSVEIPEKLTKYLGIEKWEIMKPGEYTCNYCKDVVDLFQVNQEYSIKNPYLNLCHDDLILEQKLKMFTMVIQNVIGNKEVTLVPFYFGTKNYR